MPTPDVSISEQRRAFRAWLGRRAGNAPLQFVETHVSILGMSPDRVWKLKKAVRFPFVDLSTADLRRRNALRELELNRRFAPDVYLGVVPLSPDDDSRGDVVVEMLRMPEDRRLSVVASHERDQPDGCVERIAAELARIHRDAPRSQRIAEAGSVEWLSGLWGRSLDEMRAFVPAVLDASELQRVADDARMYLAGRNALFDERVRAGRSVTVTAICSPTTCSAFSTVHAFSTVSNSTTSCGTATSWPTSRSSQWIWNGSAIVRSPLVFSMRIAATAAMPGRTLSPTSTSRIARSCDRKWHVSRWTRPTRTTDAARTARTLLGLAGEHLARGRVRLVLIGGPPATGKTTVARALAARTGWTVVHSDEVRKQLAGLEPTTSAAAGLDAGLYTSEWTARTYAAIMESARRS